MGSPADAAAAAPQDCRPAWAGEQASALARLDHLLDRARRAQTRLLEERLRLRDPERLRHRGDLIKAHFHLLRRGLDRVAVRDFATGETVEIALDPAAAPEENLRRAYRAYQRAVRGLGVIEQRLSQIEARIDRLAGARAACAGAADRSALRRAYAAAFPPGGGSPARRGAGSSTPEPGATLPYRLFVSSDGWEILVGKSGAANDALTFHVARPRDPWLHVAERSGAHVVVRRRGADEPPARTLLEAAILAVYFSAARGGGEGEVRVAETRDVRRIRGAPPGTVRLLRHREMRVRLDRAAVAGLLERRAAGDPELGRRPRRPPPRDGTNTAPGAAEPGGREP